MYLVTEYSTVLIVFNPKDFSMLPQAGIQIREFWCSTFRNKISKYPYGSVSGIVG